MSAKHSDRHRRTQGGYVADRRLTHCGLRGPKTVIEPAEPIDVPF